MVVDPNDVGIKGLEKVPSATGAILRQFQQEWPRGPRLDGLCSWCSDKIDVKDLEDRQILKEWEMSGLCVTCQIGMDSDIIEDFTGYNGYVIS